MPDEGGTSDVEQLSGLDFPINPETSGAILRRLLSNSTVRARIIDPEGNMVIDSRFLYGRGDIIQTELPPLNSGKSFLRDGWDRLITWVFGAPGGDVHQIRGLLETEFRELFFIRVVIGAAAHDDQ